MPSLEGKDGVGAMGDASLRVKIDKAACCGYGLCAEICPEVYKLDVNGIVYVDDDLVPPGLEDKAIEGAEVCPQQALAVERV
jgi:ferredoxin